MTVHTRFLVIGAGPTGLGAAARLHALGEEYLLLDRSTTVGGMATSVTDDHDYTWDLGGHVVHSHFAEFDQMVADSGVALQQVTRNGWVWAEGRLIPTPVQQQLEELPTDLRPEAPSPTLAHYYRNHFGSRLYQDFFEPYTFKMWSTPLTLIGHEWTSQRSGSHERNVPRLALRESAPTPPAASFPYPVGGAGALWDAVGDTLVDRDRVELGAEVVDIDLGRRLARLADGRRISYEQCVSTTPIIAAARWAGRTELAVRLHATEVDAIGFGFRGSPPPSLADKTWLYSPDRRVPWYRLTVLSNYDPGNAGPGRWSVLCEVSSSRYHTTSPARSVQESLLSLMDLGAESRRLDTVWHRRIDYGYPVPTLGRDAILRQIDQTLRADGFYSRGRFGGWRYESCNQDHAFMQGRQAVDNALTGSPEEAYWHP
jgi:protoporphyrinogen oxidase